ncbi:MAG: hypothetical protein I3273_01115 [Candidatus Moeniiplasma glomeromycotorum]|nr:hypothetical protein [Candidatus Moeniiplasma glomeromycotorum]MCE8167278.1 hypothetical protein [Candidatus Moeniiplasma glomeromycotorum]MCE8168709.1 hypothetical protein [Candidatus Moeniiplasma glomeromycotorum]
MKEIIIIETSQPQKVKKLLERERVNYKVYQEPKTYPKKDIFTNYDQVIKNKKREKELKLWDNLDLDEELNQEGEWWK